MMQHKVCSEAGSPGLALKESVERLHLGDMRKATSRQRQAMARKEGTRGFVLLADNLDWVCNSSQSLDAQNDVSWESRVTVSIQTAV